MSKEYKGYELIKAIADGEIKEGIEIEVHSLKVLDNIIATIKYTNKRLEWATGEFDTSYLVDNDYYFKVLEDEIDIQEQETDWVKVGQTVGKIYTEFAKGFEEAVKQLDKNKEDKQC